MPISIHKSTIHVRLQHECAKPFAIMCFWNTIVTNVIAKGKITEEFRCTIHQFMRVLNISEGVVWPMLSHSIRLFCNSDTYSTYSWGKIICIWAITLVIHMFINGKHLKLHEEKVHVFSEFGCSACDKKFENENHFKLHEMNHLLWN